MDKCKCMPRGLDVNKNVDGRASVSHSKFSYLYRRL